MTSANQQKTEIFFQPRQGPAYCGSRKMEMSGRRAARSRVGSGNEDFDLIEIGCFAHTQCMFAAMIIPTMSRTCEPEIYPQGRRISTGRSFNRLLKSQNQTALPETCDFVRYAACKPDHLFPNVFPNRDCKC